MPAEAGTAEANARGALHGALTAAHALLRPQTVTKGESNKSELTKALLHRNEALDEVSRLRSQVDRLHESLASVQRNRESDLAAAASSIEATVRQESATMIKELRMAIDVLNKEVSQRDKTIKLQQQQLLDRSTGDNAERCLLQGRIDALTADLLRRDAVLDERSSVFYDLHRKVECDEKQQQATTEALIRMQALHDRVAEAKENTLRELQQRETELQLARESVARLSNDLAEKSLQNEVVLSECDTKLQKARAELELLTRQIADLQGQNEEARAESQLLSTQIVELQDQREQARAESQLLKRQVADFQAQHEQDKANSDAAHKLELAQMTSEFTSAVAELQNSVAELLQRNSEMLADNDRLKDELDQAKSSHEELMEQLDSVCTLSDSMKLQLVAVEAAKQQAAVENAELHRSLESLTETIDDIQRHRTAEREMRESELRKRSASIEAARSLFLSSARKVSEKAVLRRAFVQWMRHQSACVFERLKAAECRRRDENEALVEKFSSLAEDRRRADAAVAELAAQARFAEESHAAMENERSRHVAELQQQLQERGEQLRSLLECKRAAEGLLAEKEREAEELSHAVAMARHAQQQLEIALAEALSNQRDQQPVPPRPAQQGTGDAAASGANDETLPSLSTPGVETHDRGSQTVAPLLLDTTSQTLALAVKEAASCATQTRASQVVHFGSQTTEVTDGEQKSKDPEKSSTSIRKEAEAEYRVRQVEHLLAGAMDEVHVSKSKIQTAYREKEESENRCKAMTTDLRQAKDAFAAAMAELEAVRCTVAELEQALEPISRQNATVSVRTTLSLCSRLDAIRRHLASLPRTNLPDSVTSLEHALPPVQSSVPLPKEEPVIIQVEQQPFSSSPGRVLTATIDGSCQTSPRLEGVRREEIHLEERKRLLSYFLVVTDQFLASVVDNVAPPTEQRDSVNVVLWSTLQRAYDQGLAKQQKYAETQRVSPQRMQPTETLSSSRDTSEERPVRSPAARRSESPAPAPSQPQLQQGTGPSLASRYSTGHEQLDKYLDGLLVKHRRDISVVKAECVKWRELYEQLIRSQLPSLEQHVNLVEEGRGKALVRLSLALESRALLRAANLAWCHWRVFAEHGKRERMRSVANKTIDALIASQLKLKAIAASAMEQNKALEGQLGEAKAALQLRAAEPPAPTPRKTDKMTQAVDDAAIVEARQAIAAVREELLDSERLNSQLSNAIETMKDTERRLLVANDELTAKNKKLHQDLVDVRLELRHFVSQSQAAEALTVNDETAKEY
jgi:hypothetical protein